MKILLSVLPIALLVAYSQIVIKWRMLGYKAVEAESMHMLDRILSYLSDPVIVSAYMAALLASFIWLYVITRLPLVVAFPIYIGATFVLVIVGGWFFLSESITLLKLLSVFLILSGIVVGVRA